MLWRIIYNLQKFARARAFKGANSRRIIYLISVLFISSLVYHVNGIQTSSKTILVYGTVLSHDGLGWLHTEGKLIKNAYGQTVCLTGVSWVELGWRDTLVDSIDHRADMMAHYGANLVHISIRRNSWLNKQSYRDYIDSCVAALRDKGIYVLLDMMFGDGETQDYKVELITTHRDSYIAELQNIIDHYKNEPAVIIFDPMNEPPGGGHPPGTSWEQAYQRYYDFIVEASRAIHQINPNILIEVDSPGWCTKLNPLYPGELINEPNLVYSVHEYLQHEIKRYEAGPYYPYDGYDFANSYREGNYTLAKQQMEEFYLTYRGFGSDFPYPIIVDEIGCAFNDYLGTGVSVEACRLQGIDIYELCSKYKVSFIGWPWRANNPEGTSGHGLTLGDYESLSPQGEIWVQYLLRLPTS